MTRRSSRRSFLASTLGASVAAPLMGHLPAQVARTTPAVEPADEKLKVLILGGTSFLGPAIIDVARARGHEITLFNRGKTNPEMYADLAQLRGDRNEGDLASLDGKTFDVVIDTSGYVPSHVQATAEKLASAGQYIFISSISVYEGFGEVAGEFDEDSPLLTVPEDFLAKVTKIQESFAHYGGMKALCEQAAETAMPGKVTNIRPGLIVGPTDPTDRFTWWPVRIAKGGQVLVPNAPEMRTQVIDVRDLGAWIVHCFENRIMGVFNADGFNGALSWQDFLGGCRCATAEPTELIWADEAFLLENKVQPWGEMPIWMPEEVFGYTNVERAIDAGLTFRPIADTIRDTLAWATEEAKSRKLFQRGGLPPEREQELITAWLNRGPTDSDD